MKTALLVLGLLITAPITIGPILWAWVILGPLPLFFAAGIMLCLMAWLRMRKTSRLVGGIEGVDRYSTTSGGLL